ncbi:hypothetical protein [Luteimonas qiangzhengi]|uniref:hypothetical protein n=1 Tax=Luteimonas sp. MJ146 TaxID=3129240 RepID=UPI0031BAE8EA
MDTKQPAGVSDTFTQRLDALEVALPDLIQANPEPSDFWEAFLAVADPLEGEAGPHQGLVQQRIATMLARHGRYISLAPLGEE